jgi:hypothetical protein
MFRQRNVTVGDEMAPCTSRCSVILYLDAKYNTSMGMGILCWGYSHLEHSS